MADNQRQIERLVNLVVGVEGAQDAARAVERVGQSADRLHARFRKVTGAARKFGDAVDFVADASSSLIAAQYGVRQAFEALGISSSQRDLANYSRTLLETRQQFAKFDESILTTERRILMLKDRFAFTRQEIATLQAQFDRGFSFQAPNRMVQVFDTLREVVGENVDAMMRLQTSVQQIGQKVPIYQELFSYGVANRSEKIAKSARNMSRALLAASAIAGDITLDELKEQLGAMAQLERSRDSAGRASKEAAEAQARTEQLNDNIRTLNELKVLWEDITMKVAEGIQPYLKSINNLLQSGGETLENWVATGLKIGSIFAAIGAVNFASSLGKLATSATTGLGFLANMGGRGRGGVPTRGMTGALSGLIGGMGSTPARPMFVYVVNQGMGSGGPMYMGGPAGRAMRGGPKPGAMNRLRRMRLGGMGGRVGMLGRLGAGTALAGSGLATAGMVGLNVGLPAYAGSALYNSQFANGDQLSEAGTGESALRIGGSVAAGAGVGALLGSVVPVIGTGIGAALGAAVGAVAGAASTLATQLNTVSEAAKKTNDAYEQSLQSRMRFASNESEYNLASLELQRNELLNALDKERSEEASIWAGIAGDQGLIGQFTGDFWGGGAEEEQLKKIQDEIDKVNRQIQKQKREIEEAQEEQEEQKHTLTATDKVLVGFVARYQLLNSFIELSNRRFDASLSKLDALSSLISSMGGVDPFSEGLDFNDSISAAFQAQERQLSVVDMARSALGQFQDTVGTLNLDNVEGTDAFLAEMQQAFNNIPAIGEVISDEVMQRLSMRGSEVQIDDLFASISAELDTAAIKSRAATERIIKSGASRFQGERDLTRSVTSRVAAEVELATNLAAGVAPSAEMRMEQVRAIQGEIVALEKELAFYQQVKATAEETIRRGLATGDEAAVEQGLVARKTAEQSINELVAERTQMMAKQASITKVIRDGYISAIAAMSTGAGMFTQITIDQNKNLGQLQAATNNAVVSLRSGAMARGLTTSERFTAGGIMSEGRRFGASDDVNQLITESNPLGAFFDVEDDMRDGISSTGARIVEVWQQEAGRFFSTMGESLRTQPYGTAELQDYISENKGTATIGNGRVPGTVPVQVEVEGRNRGGIIGDGATGPNRDSTLVAMTTGEGVLTRETVAQNGGAEFVDSLNSGITIESMMNAARKREREEMAKQLDEFNLRGASRIKERFLKDFPYLWHEKLYKDESFYDLSSMTDGSTFTADQYEALNERYMTVRRRLSNLRYLLPSPSMTQQKISEREDEVHAQYEALMGEFASSDMARFGTDPNPLLQATEEAVRQAESFRQQIREQRSPLQEGIDDMSFAARMSELSETPLGVRVPSMITDLASYEGATRSAQDISTGEQQSAYDQWRNGIVEEMDFFTRKMKARIKATRRGSDKRYGNKQLAAWRSIAEDLIKRGKPYDYMADPNFVGPIPPSPGESPQISGGLTDADASASYEEMQAELDRRKEIITNRMIAWRRDQANAIMAQLASAESVSAKTAIVAQLEDFDVNTQRIYERLEDARFPAQIEEMLPQLRALGIRGLPIDVFDNPVVIEQSQSNNAQSGNPFVQAIDGPLPAFDETTEHPMVRGAHVGMQELYAMPTATQEESIKVAKKAYEYQKYFANVAGNMERARSNRLDWIEQQKLQLEALSIRYNNLEDGEAKSAIRSQIDDIIAQDARKDQLEVSFVDGIGHLRQYFKELGTILEAEMSSITDTSLVDMGFYQDWVMMKSNQDMKPQFPETMPIQQSYATGGIATPRPGGQLARLAEAGKSEAVVPLPDGSSIPVMFQNDSASMASMPEPIMNSVSTGVNGYLDSPGSSITEGSQRVEIALSSQDKKRVADSFVAEMTAMMTTVIQRSEQRILDDLRVRR